MQKDLSERRRRWPWIVLSVSALAGCTAYQPLDGGSQVPWASRQVAAPAPTRSLAVNEPLPVRARPVVARVEPVGQSVDVMPVSAPAAPVSSPTTAPQIAPKPAAAVVAAAAAPTSRGGQHRVARGERLGAVAERYGVSLPAMAQANGLSSPYVIYVGQTLEVPGGGVVAPRHYVVRRGDTLSAVARRFDVAQADIAATNGLASPYALSVGQALEIRGVQTARAVPDAAPPPLTGAGFLWPVNGKVIGGFGVAGNGQRRNGINIAARKGAPVVASEDGVVVYASDGIDGYGRMVLVRHAEGYITTYAHNAALLVEVGDLVRRGQVIARVGQTGDVSQSQLHFELRRGTKPIDPESVLVRDPTAVASRL